MFLLDPKSGRRRRALLGDQMTHTAHLVSRAADKIAEDAGNRGQGMIRLRDSLFACGDVSDAVLAERVRARIGRVAGHPGSIEVAVESGKVTLSGPVLAEEVPRLLASVGSVRGVAGVENALDIHAVPGGEPGLQGFPAPRAPEFEYLQQH
jgi:osmotically-inducible protein OsmY